MSREYTVYILKCSDGSYYTGICNNLARRLSEHKEGGDPKCYTWKKRPIKLVYQEIFCDVLDAIEREKQIKKWTRAKKQALIQENWEKLILLAKCKVSLNASPIRQAQGDTEKPV